MVDMIVSILQVRQLRHREGKLLPQSHTASKWVGRNLPLKPVLFPLPPAAPPTLTRNEVRHGITDLSKDEHTPLFHVTTSYPASVTHDPCTLSPPCLL